MSKTERILLVSALTLLGGGCFLYDLGSRLNLEVANYQQELWEQAPGDKWLYVGGLMLLIAGSLAVAAFRLWIGGRREQQAQR